MVDKYLFLFSRFQFGLWLHQAGSRQLDAIYVRCPGRPLVRLVLLVHVPAAAADPPPVARPLHRGAEGALLAGREEGTRAGHRL